MGTVSSTANEIWQAFLRIKEAFDPDWLLNPGQVVFRDDVPTDMRENLRFAPAAPGPLKCRGFTPPFHEACAAVGDRQRDAGHGRSLPRMRRMPGDARRRDAPDLSSGKRGDHEHPGRAPTFLGRRSPAVCRGKFSPRKSFRPKFSTFASAARAASGIARAKWTSPSLRLS